MEELIKQLRDYGFSDDYLKVVEEKPDFEMSIPNSLEVDDVFTDIPEDYISDSDLTNMSFCEQF